MFSALKKSPGLKLGCMIVAIATLTLGWFCFVGNPSGLTHRFVAGQRLVFEVKYMTASTSNFMGLAADEDAASGKRQGQTNLAHTNLESELVVTVLEASKEGNLVEFELRNPSIQIATNGELAIEQTHVIEAELQRPIFADVNAQGRIVSIRFETEVQPLSQAFAKTLLASVQVVLPVDPLAKSWQTQEDDPNGKYFANYVLSTGDGDVFKIEKNRDRYVPRKIRKLIHTFESETIVKPAGSVAVEFDGMDGVIKSITGEELNTVVVEGRTVARSETTLSVKLTRREKVAKAELKSMHAKLAAAGSKQALSTPGDQTRRETAMQRTELGDATMESLLIDLAKRQIANDPEADDTQLYLKLKALIHLHPEVCVQLAKELSVVPADGPALAMLCGALSSVGHTQAQTALQSGIRARAGDWSALMFLVPALGLVETPTVATEQVLREVARTATDEQVRSTAQLSLGIVARTLTATEPDRSRKILQETLASLEGAKTSESRRQLLLVLGNIGAEDTMPAITRYLGDEAAPVRAAATSALRWMDSAEVDALLVKVLTTEADEHVRLEAAQALSFRPMTAASLSAHQTLLSKDTSASVRLALLPNVAKASRVFSEARGILTNVGRNDTTVEVRDEANRLLAEMGN